MKYIEPCITNIKFHCKQRLTKIFTNNYSRFMFWWCCLGTYNHRMSQTYLIHTSNDVTFQWTIYGRRSLRQLTLWELTPSLATPRQQNRTRCHKELTEKTPLITSDTDTKCQHFKGAGNSLLNKMQQGWIDQAAAAIACRNATLDHTQWRRQIELL